MKSIVLSALLLAIPAPAESHSFIDDVVGAFTPRAAQDLCDRYTWACSNETKPYDDSQFEIVKSINSKVNRKISPVEDKALYNVNEYWALPERGKGDCEDYALQKKYELINAGISPDRLFISIVLDGKKAHAILIFRGGDGDYVLDNMTSRILPWNEMKYVPIMMQNPSDLKAWAIIRDRDRQ